MTLDEFVLKWKDKVCDWDGYYGTQCMDLMNFYAYDVLGMNRVDINSSIGAPTAAESYLNGRWAKFFNKTDNTLTNVPKKGDILFYGTKVGPAGHVCIVVSATVLNFKSFDANWPTGSLPHLQDHNYNGVLGWLRFKTVETIPTIDPVVNKYESAYKQIKAVIEATEASK